MTKNKSEIPETSLPEIPDAKESLISHQRNHIYRIFTIANGDVSEGSRVDTLKLKGAGIEIPAVIVGESGRGRQQGVLPVSLPDGDYKKWKEGEKVIIHSATIGSTRAGKPKLFASGHPNASDHIIAVLRTPIGYRGGNSHTGDRAGWKCRSIGCEAFTEGPVNIPDVCPDCGKSGYWDGPSLYFSEFPGEALAEGGIAQGAAGRAGSGAQQIAIIPKDSVFRTGYSGRRYGAPPAHYYLWNGQSLLSATWEERAVSDIF